RGSRPRPATPPLPNAGNPFWLRLAQASPQSRHCFPLGERASVCTIAASHAALHRSSGWIPTYTLAAFAVSAVQARHAPIHHHDGGGRALRAQLRAFREVAVRERVDLLLLRFELRLLLFDELLAMLIQVGCFEQTDRLQVLFDHVAELSDDRGHELAARLPVAAARVEDGFQLFDEERHVAAFAEHGGDDARERNDPLEVVEVLRVDED